MLVVAADDGPRAQTIEHLALLDALGIRARAGGRHQGRRRRPGTDRRGRGRGRGGCSPGRRSPARRPRRVVAGRRRDRRACGRRSSGSATAVEVPARAAGRPRRAAASRLAIDRVFAVKGRGAVVTGSLRGGGRGPRRDAAARAGRPVGAGPRGPGPRRDGGCRRSGPDGAQPGRRRRRRPAPRAGPDRRPGGRRERPAARPPATSPLPDRAAGAAPSRARPRSMRRSGGAAGMRSTCPTAPPPAILRLAGPIAIAPGDRFVLRRRAARDPIVGGLVLDAAPARGVLAAAPDGRAGRAPRRGRRRGRRDRDRGRPARPPRDRSARGDGTVAPGAGRRPRLPRAAALAAVGGRSDARRRPDRRRAGAPPGRDRRPLDRRSGRRARDRRPGRPTGA